MTWTPTDWSSDGEWIALTGRREKGKEDVYLLRVDGTMVRLTVDHRSSSAVFLDGTRGVGEERETLRMTQDRLEWLAYAIPQLNRAESTQLDHACHHSPARTPAQAALTLC